MTWAKPAFQWLAWLFIAGLALQFFFAGLGVFGGESLEPHKGLAGPLELIALVMFVLAIVGKMGGKLIGMSLVLFLLIGLQYLWADESLKPMWLRSFHVFDAFLIAGIGFHLAQASGFPLKKSR